MNEGFQAFFIRRFLDNGFLFHNGQFLEKSDLDYHYTSLYIVADLLCFKRLVT